MSLVSIPANRLARLCKFKLRHYRRSHSVDACSIVLGGGCPNLGIQIRTPPPWDNSYLEDALIRFKDVMEKGSQPPCLADNVGFGVADPRPHQIQAVCRSDGRVFQFQAMHTPQLQAYGAKTSASRGQTSALWVNPQKKSRSYSSRGPC